MADQQGITNIDWRRGDSYHLAELGLHDVALTTMGASFHWMDRPAVLKALDQITQPGGAVVVVSGGAPEGADKPGWNEIVTAVRTRWLGAERRAGSGTYTHPPQRHEEILAESPFGHVEVVDWTWTQERDLDLVVGLQFSYSYSAPALLGEKADEFAAELRRELLAVNPSGAGPRPCTPRPSSPPDHSRHVHTPLPPVGGPAMSTATDHRAADPLYDRIAAVYDPTRQLPAWAPDRLADEALRLSEPVRRPRVLEVGSTSS